MESLERNLLARTVVSILAATILIMAPGVVRAESAGEPRVEITAPDGARRAIVKVEIANNNSSREIGLMYRKHMDRDAGMLFVFQRPAHQTFWMKNTEIPLDMIFADANGKIVGIAADAQPYSEKILSVDGDSQYVLEVNGGFAKHHNIRPGDTMKFIGFEPTAKD